MKTLCYVLLMIGMALAIGGVVAVFNFDQPADMFSGVWWMIVGGWGLALVGMGIDILKLFKVAVREPAYTFHAEVESGNGVEQEITRIS
jgi:membrane protease YdiL (CAAX protease family)